MASSRASNVSEFRQVLSRLKDLHEKLERSDQSSLAAKLSDINDSLSIIEGNQTDFSDTVLQTLERIHSTMVNGFKTMEDRISTLEAKLTSHETGSYDAVTPPNSSRKRKIARHPDLSHYVRSKMEQLGLSWNTERKENEPPNQEVARRLLKEVQEVEHVKNDSLFTERRIFDAVSQNFASNKRKRRQVENGTYEQYQREQKRRQRIKRKLEKRLRVVTEEEKKSELFEALHLSMISSDESDGEDDTLSTKHLVWRAEEVSSFFKELDSRHRANNCPPNKGGSL